MSRQWTVVGIVVVALIGGTYALVSSAPPRIEVGVQAPDYSAIEVATGDTVSILNRYPGDVVLVNIWGTWCDPCREEIPALDSVYRALGPKGFHILAVSVQEPSMATVKDFVKQYGLSFDVLNDPSGGIQSVYQTTGVPESFLVNKQGRIVRIIQRAHPWNSPASRAIIEELLNAPAS